MMIKTAPTFLHYNLIDTAFLQPNEVAHFNAFKLKFIASSASGLHIIFVRFIKAFITILHTASLLFQNLFIF